MKTKLLVVAIISIISIAACNKDGDNSPAYTTTDYQLNYPGNFPAPYLSDENKMTVEGVDLGRSLYYDNILSSNGLSCSSCHLSQKSFSIGLHSLHGVVKSVPPHINLAWNPEYNWDGGEEVLEHLPMGDFGPDFFNTDMDGLYDRLDKHEKYPGMFYRAFGITNFYKLNETELQETICDALAQFLRSMVSSESRYDKFIRHEIQFTVEEVTGFQIFNSEIGDCFHCHGGALVTDNLFHNTGLDENPTGYNGGRYNITGNILDLGKFSSPTLRNIELTALYMHDGRFQTLEEVVEFYNSGVHQNSPNIDPIMTKPGKEYGLELTPYQKNCLVQFLKTFTDTEFINNPAYLSPL
jgi:cytochrome c peroxidase